MTQKDRAGSWAEKILRRLREAVAGKFLDPSRVRMLVLGFDESYGRLRCWSRDVWGYEFGEFDHRPSIEENLPLFSIGIPDLLEESDRLDGLAEAEIPVGNGRPWQGLRDESRPRFSAAVGELLTRTHQDLEAALREVAGDPFSKEFPGMPAFCVYGRTELLPSCALRLLCFAGHPDATPLLPFLEHRAQRPGRKTLRLRGWAARSATGIRLFFPEGEVPEFDRGAQRPTTVHYAWNDLDQFTVDSSPLHPQPRIGFQVRGETVQRAYFPRRPVAPDDGNPGQMLDLFSGDRLALQSVPDWDRDPVRPQVVASASSIPEADHQALEEALGEWIGREYQVLLRAQPGFLAGSVTLTASTEAVTVMVGAPESFIASVAPWRGTFGEGIPATPSRRADPLREIYRQAVVGMAAVSNHRPEYRKGTVLGNRLAAILVDPEARRRLFMGLLRRVEGVQEFRTSSSGRVYFAIESDGVVRTLRDSSRPWVPFRPPLADRSPFQELLVTGDTRGERALTEDVKGDLSLLKLTIEYAMAGVPLAVEVMESVTGTRMRNAPDRSCMNRIERELGSADPELQKKLIGLACRELSLYDDPAFERFMYDFVLGAAPAEIRGQARDAIVLGAKNRDDQTSHPFTVRHLKRVFGTATKFVAFAVPAIGRMKGRWQVMRWDSMWIRNLFWVVERSCLGELLTVPGEAHLLVQSMLSAMMNLTREEDDWARDFLRFVIDLHRHPQAPEEWRKELIPVLEGMQKYTGEKGFTIGYVVQEGLRPGGLSPRNAYGDPV